MLSIQARLIYCLQLKRRGAHLGQERDDYICTTPRICFQFEVTVWPVTQGFALFAYLRPLSLHWRICCTEAWEYMAVTLGLCVMHNLHKILRETLAEHTNHAMPCMHCIELYTTNAAIIGLYRKRVFLVNSKAFLYYHQVKVKIAYSTCFQNIQSKSLFCVF